MKSTRITTTIYFIILLIVAPFLSQSQIRGVAVDGRISYSERFDTSFSKATTGNDDDILIRKENNHYYFGIRNEVANSVNLILIKGDSCVIIHISGSVGRAVYQQVSKDSFVVTKPILWVTRNPESWDMPGRMVYERYLNKKVTDNDIINEMQANLSKNGYTASTIDMGSYRDIEAIISIARFKDWKLLIQYRKQVPRTAQVQSNIALYPIQANIAAQLQQFTTLLAATPGTSVKIVLDTRTWMVID